MPPYGYLLNLDWTVIAHQKALLLALSDRKDMHEYAELLGKLIDMIDTLQEQAAELGEPVVWQGDLRKKEGE